MDNLDILPIATESAQIIYTSTGIEKFFTLVGMVFLGICAAIGLIIILGGLLIVVVKLIKNGHQKR